MLLRSGRSLGEVILSTLLLSSLVACGGGGGGGGGNSGGSGNGGNTPPPPTTSRLTLTGTVTDAPIASAVVTATIGGQTFTATADANGNYSLPLSVEESATGGFITLTAKGVGSQSYVEFTSLIGTFQALKAQAGGDEVLSSAENFATQITNVSTALAVLLQEANGGQPVSSQALIDTLTRELDGQEMLDLASAIKLLVDEADTYPLPSGYTSLKALLADSTARERLVTDLFLQDPAAFKLAQTAIVSDATLIRPAASTTLPTTLTAIVRDDNGQAYYDVDRAVSYTFLPDGTGMASAGTWHRNMTWSRSGGSVEVVYERPLNTFTYELGVCPDMGAGNAPAGYVVSYTTPGAKLTLLGNQLLAITEVRDVIYRDCGPLPSAPEAVTVARTIVGDEDSQPIDIAELSGSTRTLWIYNEAFDGPEPERSLMPDLAELHADGTGTTRAFGKHFTWSLEPGGRIVAVTFDDGITAKFRSLREIDSVASEILYEFTLPTGRRVDAGASVRSDPQPQLAFTTDNVVGRQYRYGVDDPPFAPGMKGSRYRFDANGLGTREVEILNQDGSVTVLDRDSEFTPHYGFRWHIDGEELILQYTSNGSDEFNCDLTAPLCQLNNDIRITPLARVGTRTYWFETWRDRLTATPQEFLTHTNLSYYDHEPFGATPP